MDPKQQHDIDDAQGMPLSMSRKNVSGGHLLGRIMREARADEQKGIDVAAFTSSV